MNEKFLFRHSHLSCAWQPAQCAQLPPQPLLWNENCPSQTRSAGAPHFSHTAFFTRCALMSASNLCPHLGHRNSNSGICSLRYSSIPLYYNRFARANQAHWGAFFWELRKQAYKNRRANCHAQFARRQSSALSLRQGGKHIAGFLARNQAAVLYVRLFAPAQGFNQVRA